MKKIFMALILIAGLVSCEVQSSRIRKDNSSDLYIYTTGVCGNYVAVPVELLEMLLAFDEYMASSDMAADPRFYGQVEKLHDNVYRFNDQWEWAIQCTVDTQGKSLHEEGATWLLAYLNAWQLGGDELFRGLYDYSLPAYTEIRMTDKANSIWTIAYKDEFETVLKYKGSEDGRDQWSVTANGYCFSDNPELSARFTTGKEPLEVSEKKRTDHGYHGNTYKGTFDLKTYRKNVLLDYCNVTFHPGFATQYETGK